MEESTRHHFASEYVQPAHVTQRVAGDGLSCGDGAYGLRIAVDDVPALRRLEAILHPLVQAAERRFLATQRRRRVPVVVLDIPLLFETKGERRCDGVIVVSAPLWLQRQRVLRRPGVTPARLDAILARQMPDAEKRRRADWVVPTGLGRTATLRHLRKILREVAKRR